MFTFLVPAISPYIWDYRAIDYSTVWIKWVKVSQEHVRGILRGYRIYISLRYWWHVDKPFKNITVGPDVLEARITGLQSYTYYTIWVKAFTSKGESIRENKRSIRTSKSTLRKYT